jgi:hypothetical protein
MTKQEILEMYDIDETGVIITPGKFEREMYYAVHFWDTTLNGLCDREEILDDDTVIAIFDLDQRDYADFPELEGNTELRIWSDDNGFVYCQVD